MLRPAQESCGHVVQTLNVQFRIRCEHAAVGHDDVELACLEKLQLQRDRASRDAEGWRLDGVKRHASNAWDQGRNAMDVKRIGSGLLMQIADNKEMSAAELKVVTKKQPTPAQIADLLFAWRVAKYVKSNAIVFCANGQTLGVGAGQMSRIDSARIASIKAANAGLTLRGSVVASDAFFPFRDGVDMVAESGAIAIIQPGGSIRDDEVIKAADEHGVSMVYTGVRHFRH